MGHAVKIAITLPDNEYRQIESFRKKLGGTRSGVILSALKHWRECSKNQKKIGRYQEGYVEHPEKTEEWNALEEAQAAILTPEDWS